MAHIEVVNAKAIRKETSHLISGTADKAVYQVFDFEHDKDTFCYLVSPTGRSLIPCEDALVMTRNGVYRVFAHNTRFVCAVEYVNKDSIALYTLTAMLVFGAGTMFLFGKD